MPSSLVVAVCFWLVSRFVRVTVTPETTPPPGSVTTPLIEARYCACADPAKIAAQANTKTARKESLDRLMTCSFTPKIAKGPTPSAKSVNYPFGGEYSHLEFECQRFLV